MGQNFVASLKAEIEDLEASLRLDVRYVRLIELKKIFELYSQNTSSASLTEMSNINNKNWIVSSIDRQRPVSFSSNERSDVASNNKTVGRRASPEKSRAIEAVALHLANRVGPVPTRDLLDHIVDLGIEIGGTMPVNNLSAMLSNSDQFDSHGRSGWTLKKKRTAQQISIEAMEQASSRLLNALSDESLAGIQGYIREFSALPENVTDGLHAAYEEITDFEITSLDNRKLKAIFEDLLVAEIGDRSNNFVQY